MKTTLFLLLLLPTLLHAQSIENPLRLNMDDGTREQVAPSVTTGGDGTIYAMWVDLRSGSQGHLYMRRSDDGGVSFSDEVIVYDDGNVPAGGWRSASMAVAPNGTLHVAWVESIGHGDTDIRYTRSTDRGETFSDPVSVVDDGVGAVQDFPSIAIDSSGRLYIAWIDGRELKKGESDYDQIWSTTSSDDGQTFAAPRRASYAPGGVGGSCECCPTVSATTPNGHFLIAYRSNVENVRDIFVARSRDGGATFETAIPVPSESWPLFACPVSGPGLAVDRFGTAHIMWKDGRPSAGNDQYLYYTILPEGADAVPGDLRLSTEFFRTNHPATGVTPAGGIVTVFDSYRAGKTSAIYFGSADGGNTFAAQASLAPESSGTNRQLAELAIGPDDTRYIVWQDDATGNSDILFARDTTVMDVIVPGSVTQVSPEEGADITPTASLVWTAPENLTATGRVIYDIEIERTDGKSFPQLLVGTTILSASDLPNGDYRWRVRARTSTGASEWSAYATFTMSGSSSVTDTEDAEATWRVGPNPIASGEMLEVSATFATPSSAPVTITLVASDGRRVAELFRGVVTGERIDRAFDVAGVSAGAYWVVVERDGVRRGRGVVVW